MHTSTDLSGITLSGDRAPQSSFMPPMFGLRRPGEGAELDLEEDGGARKDGVDDAVEVGNPVATVEHNMG